MKRRCCGYVVRGLYAILIAVWTISVQAQDTESESVADAETLATMQAIDTGIRQWRDALNMKCDFRYTQGLAASLEDALNGKFVGGDGEKANCRFVKMGDAVLYDFRIEGQPSSGEGSLASVLMASANQVEATINRTHPNSPLHFFDVSGEKEGAQLHRQRGQTNVFPFVLLGGNSGALFQPMIDSNLRTFSSKREGALVVVTCQPKIGQAKHYTIDTSGPYPLLQSTKSEDGNDVTMASDFIALENGCSFPGRLVIVSGPNVPIGSTEPQWLSRIWEIVDSKISEPTKDDFVIDLGPEANVYGLKSVETPVNMLDITLDSLDKEKADQPRMDVPKGRPQSSQSAPRIRSNSSSASDSQPVAALQDPTNEYKNDADPPPAEPGTGLPIIWIGAGVFILCGLLLLLVLAKRSQRY